MTESKYQIKPECLNVKRKGGDKHRVSFWSVLCSQSHFENLTRGIWLVRVAHEFQLEISMSSSFEQGENVASWSLVSL
jgi:hypothetical protein